MISQRLGPYEVVAKLGEGGMGEVYKARDPRLNRWLAIKILAGSSSLNAERRDRFAEITGMQLPYGIEERRQARAASAVGVVNAVHVERIGVKVA